MNTQMREGSAAPALEQIPRIYMTVGRSRSSSCSYGGSRMPQIASELGIQLQTVKNMLSGLYAKLGVSTRSSSSPRPADWLHRLVAGRGHLYDRTACVVVNGMMPPLLPLTFRGRATPTARGFRCSDPGLAILAARAADCVAAGQRVLQPGDCQSPGLTPADGEEPPVAGISQARVCPTGCSWRFVVLQQEPPDGSA